MRLHIDKNNQVHNKRITVWSQDTIDEIDIHVECAGIYFYQKRYEKALNEIRICKLKFTGAEPCHYLLGILTMEMDLEDIIKDGGVSS